MRFCPFCSAENLDEASECAACARRLPPLSRRRRQAGAGKSGAVTQVVATDDNGAGGLGARTKSLSDMSPSPSAGRRETTQPPPTPEGVVERRKATASPDSRGGRRQTSPPVPSRAARDLRASLSTGVAPGLASESIPLPDLNGRAGQQGTGSQPYVAVPTPSATPAPVVPAPAAHAPTPPATAAPIAPTPPATAAPIAATPPATVASDQEWPAPVTSAAAHPDDWTLETPAPTPGPVAPTPAPTPVPAPAPSTPAPVVPAPVNPVGATELVTTISQPNVPQRVTDPGSAPAQWPPPTRVTALQEPFKTPQVMPVPNVPEAGLWKALKYTVTFERARWQRRGAIKSLRGQMREDTGMLDGILGALGKQARALGIESKPLESENRAIAEAEGRRKTADHECSELSNRQAEENSKFADSENERQSKVVDAESSLETAQAELGALEAQKKDLRDQGKSIDNRKKHYLKTAESRDTESGKQEDSASRLEMRQGAQSLRTDAAELDKERQDIERRIEALEKPIAQISARVGALKSDLDAAKRALTNLREGHRHRLAEIEAELGSRTRELAQSEAEIQRREVTLGTLVNLNRIERVEFQELYQRIDGLRGGIGARSNSIDKLSAEREAYDKASRIRGAIVLAGAFVLFCALLAILLSL